MRKILMIAVIAAAAGAAHAGEQALGTLQAAVGEAAAVVRVQEPAPVPAGKVFFQRWGSGGQGNGFFKPWKSAAGTPGYFMGVEACSVLDGIYPADMTGKEAQDMLGGCFAGISAKYGVPVTFAAEGTEMTILVGQGRDGEPGGNAKAAAALGKALAARGGRLFDFQVSIALAK